MERVAMIFDNFDIAMETHKKIFKLLREKGYVTHKDFANIRGETNYYDDEIYTRFGWDNLQTMKVEPCKHEDNWCIIMPEMIELKRKGEN